ncbi:MAG: threonylcarbamoyl-AMP synthase [Myxococcales bacterium]|nr:threonylcarbamoyl-AMP synthase [Myxococcales bacterium]
MIRIAIHPHAPPATRPVARAITELHKGAVAAYPTDTIYALGCAIDARRSAEALYRIKGMEKSQRLALICPDLSTAALYAHFSQAAFRLAQRVFPGPYTMVLPASRKVPRILMDRRRRTVGIRIVDHPVTSALVRGLGRPLLTTSAVGEDGEICVDADDVEEQFPRGIDLLIDSGPTPGEVSTVLGTFGEEIEVIREGLGPIP